MRDVRNDMIEIAKTMVDGQVDSLRLMRNLFVDLKLVSEAKKHDSNTFAALFIAKQLIADVWENLATDASFEFDGTQLKSFIMAFGESLVALLSEPIDHSIALSRFGEASKWLFEYFEKISEKPEILIGRKK